MAAVRGEDFVGAVWRRAQRSSTYWRPAAQGSGEGGCPGFQGDQACASQRGAGGFLPPSDTRSTSGTTACCHRASSGFKVIEVLAARRLSRGALCPSKPCCYTVVCWCHSVKCDWNCSLRRHGLLHGLLHKRGTSRSPAFRIRTTEMNAFDA